MVNSSSARLVFLALLATLTALALGAGSGSEVVTAVSLLIVVNRIVEPLSEVAAHGVAIRVAGAQIQAVEAVLAAHPLPEPARPAATPLRTDVELANVDFGYTAGRRVLDGVSFTMPEGSMTALVGASGAGKTTLVRLIARFWDVTGGAVRIGGVDVRELSTAQLMTLLSPVFQDTYLFSGTLMDNLRLARPDATEDEITAAAELARVGPIVERLPQGWQTQVGEGGTALSGGERQAIGLARLFLRKPRMVLLDEPTAHLDVRTEFDVFGRLAEHKGDATVVLISHRLSTVRPAGRIVLLRDGRVAEDGTHEDLLALGGDYHRFFTVQAAAFASEPARDPP
jgi:ATP-binding cassette subfamily B protein